MDYAQMFYDTWDIALVFVAGVWGTYAAMRDNPEVDDLYIRNGDA